jgi:uncharacterized protein (TIGR02118 family)
MVRVTVAYPKTDGTRFDFEYYLQKHIPMVRELGKPFGLSAVHVSRGISGVPGGDPSFYCIASLDFPSPDNVMQTLGTHGMQIMGDIPNYTDVRPKIQLDEVVEV